jgi:hypothetical protein|tara:strand:+ start:284 stop:856 length:573 start_codon:yes stop_codon:yes gene_type:complete
MARTLTVNKGGGTDYSPGWKTITISRGAYGVFDDTKYLDVWFEGYPENVHARIYAKISKGEEFAIGQVFRFANAGITGALDGSNGTMVIKMDDNPALLAGKQVNAYFYKEGKYSRVLKQFAPTIFKNHAEEFNENDVEYWKGRAEKYYTDYVEPKIDNTTGHDTNSFVSPAITNTNETSTDQDLIDDVPF